MENVLKLLLLAVGVIIVVGIISYVMTLNNTSTQLMNSGLNQLNAEIAGLNDTDKVIYDGTTLSGSDVIQAIQKYNLDPNICVIVSTKDTKDSACNILYDEEIITRAIGGEAITDIISTYVTEQPVSGWPKFDAARKEITVIDATTGTSTTKWANLRLPTKSLING